MFALEFFRKQMYCIEEDTCGIVGTFRLSTQSFGAPRSDSALGKLFPLAPLVTPFVVLYTQPLPKPHSDTRAQPALHFGGGIFMKFHSMTPTCLFNRGTTFSQTVTYNNNVFLPQTRSP